MNSPDEKEQFCHKHLNPEESDEDREVPESSEEESGDGTRSRVIFYVGSLPNEDSDNESYWHRIYSENRDLARNELNNCPACRSKFAKISLCVAVGDHQQTCCSKDCKPKDDDDDEVFNMNMDDEDKDTVA
ncbi:hypothetical protein L596_001751 [Steinernema carpocapsae]|uniref:Uncharacterized protein n=1 Tax=Steinernema carpocapsae TaxID=34508 RepID=A0A4U8UN59_STECR|nr:hypothetical protein L596_001751 [Steinernema carpocapsae]